ncbi:MAG: glutamate synthase large subunit, partial [Pseudomonadota bacterium]|nr:glutamate synthase large subunit [Pseudomonadota bacterium]
VLREKHFIGLPEMVENYFRGVVRETREILAELGVNRLQDLIGRTEFLEAIEGRNDKQRHLDLSPILAKDPVLADRTPYCVVPRNEPFDRGELAEQMVRDTLPAIEGKLGGIFHYEIHNTNRSIGARVSGEIARRHGNIDMSSTPVTVKLRGTAGQSFGVWNAGGLNMELEGDANDYVGKGMAGGRLVIYPPRASRFESRKTTIIGNTCLYGATGGTLYASGLAGERFAVRNSGAFAVVEGIGDHGCEYMTGGVVVVLGSTGVNFGAGMTGGCAFVLDLDHGFTDCYNPEMIDIQRVNTDATALYLGYLRRIIRDFTDQTGSHWGAELLRDFPRYAGRFWLVKPKASELETLLDNVRQR